MTEQIALDEWIIIPIREKKVMFGRDVGTKSYRVTSEITQIDRANPPRWALTRSGSRYYLQRRAAHISKYAYAAALDTLLQRGYPADDVARYMRMAERIIKECNTDEVFSMFGS